MNNCARTNVALFPVTLVNAGNFHIFAGCGGMQHPLVAEVDADMVNIAVTTMEENKIARLGVADRQQGVKLRAAIARQAEALLGKDMLHET